MSQTTTPDEDEGNATSKLDGQGIRWGFSQKANGDCVLRNWDLFRRAAMRLCEVLIVEITFLIIGLLLIKYRQVSLEHMPSMPTAITVAGLVFIVFFLLFGGSAIWRMYQENKGVLVTRETITYPVRLGTYGIFPLYRNTVRIDRVLDASPLKVHEGTYKYSHVAYLSGEFGEAKIFFESKGGRDRLLAILKTRFPKVSRYRRT
jgi:hypothetical protein